MVKWRFTSHGSAPVRPQLPPPLLHPVCYDYMRYIAAVVHDAAAAAAAAAGVALIQFLAACVLQRCTRRTHVSHTLGHPFWKQDSAEYEDREPDMVQAPATGDPAGAPPGPYVVVKKERLVPAGRLRLRQGHLSLVCRGPALTPI